MPINIEPRNINCHTVKSRIRLTSETCNESSDINDDIDHKQIKHIGFIVPESQKQESKSMHAIRYSRNSSYEGPFPNNCNALKLIEKSIYSKRNLNRKNRIFNRYNHSDSSVYSLLKNHHQSDSYWKQADEVSPAASKFSTPTSYKSGSGSGSIRSTCSTSVSNDSSFTSSEITDYPPSESQLSLPEPPDGGWGWIVVVAAFFTHLVNEGVVFSFGVILEDFMEEYGEGISSTSWVGSLAYGVPNLCAPISTLIIEKFGCRVTCIVGGIISAIGCFGSFFVNNIYGLFFTFGILSGIGSSLCFTAALVIVSLFFEERRATATGFSVSGVGFGCLVFPPFINYLVRTYTLKGSLMLTGAIYLQCCVFGALMRPVENSQQRNSRHKLLLLEHLAKSYGLGNITRSELYQNATVAERTQILKKHILTPQLNQSTKKDSEISKIDSKIVFHHDLFTIPENEFPEFSQEPFEIRSKSLTHVDNKALFENSSYRRAYSNPAISPILPELSVNVTYPNDIIPRKDLPRRNQNQRYHNTKKSHIQHHSYSYYHGSICENYAVIRSRSCSSMPELIPRRRRKLISDNSLRNTSSRGLTDFDNSPTVSTTYLNCFGKFNCCSSDSSESSDSSSACDYDLSDESSESDKVENLKEKFIHYREKYCDFSIYRNMKFLCFNLSCLITFFWYNVTYFFMGLYASEAKIPEDRIAYLFSILGGFNTLAQVLMGWLADREWINTTILYSLSMIFCGITTCLGAQNYNLTCFIVFSAAFGIFISAIDALPSVLLVDYLGLKRLTSGLGSCLFYQGLANIIGPPLIGKLITDYGFEKTFAISGIALIISGLVLFPIVLKRWHRKCRRRIRRQFRKHHSSRNSLRSDSPKKKRSESTYLNAHPTV